MHSRNHPPTQNWRNRNPASQDGRILKKQICDFGALLGSLSKLYQRTQSKSTLYWNFNVYWFFYKNDRKWDIFYESCCQVLTVRSWQSGARKRILGPPSVINWESIWIKVPTAWSCFEFRFENVEMTVICFPLPDFVQLNG